eukprot:343207-Pyramimonas_sp.AAC.1
MPRAREKCFEYKDAHLSVQYNSRTLRTTPQGATMPKDRAKSPGDPSRSAWGNSQTTDAERGQGRCLLQLKVETVHASKTAEQLKAR